LGILDGVIIDQHFRERNRLFRLATAISTNPGELAIGIDENTALHIIDDKYCRVYGSNSVTVLDGEEMEYTAFSETTGSNPITMCGMKFHVLTKGFGFNIETRKPILDKIKIKNNQKQKLKDLTV
jgi:cyanophycinase